MLYVLGFVKVAMLVHFFQCLVANWFEFITLLLIIQNSKVFYKFAVLAQDLLLLYWFRKISNFNFSNKHLGVDTSKWNVEISDINDSSRFFLSVKWLEYLIWKEFDMYLSLDGGCFKGKERLKMWKLNLGLLSVYFWLIFQ